MLGVEKVITLSLFTILAAAIRLVHRQLIAGRLSEKQKTGAGRVERSKNDCGSNRAAVSIL